MDGDSFFEKLKRVPNGVKVTIAVIFILMALLTLVFPPWPAFLFFLVALELFCPHFNILGGSCGATIGTYIFGWTVIAIAVVILIWLIRKLWAAWESL